MQHSFVGIVRADFSHDNITVRSNSCLCCLKRSLKSIRIAARLNMERGKDCCQIIGAFCDEIRLQCSYLLLLRLDRLSEWDFPPRLSPAQCVGLHVYKYQSISVNSPSRVETPLFRLCMAFHCTYTYILSLGKRGTTVHYELSHRMLWVTRLACPQIECMCGALLVSHAQC